MENYCAKKRKLYEKNLEDNRAKQRERYRQNCIKKRAQKNVRSCKNVDIATKIINKYDKIRNSMNSIYISGSVEIDRKSVV